MIAWNLVVHRFGPARYVVCMRQEAADGSPTLVQISGEYRNLLDATDELLRIEATGELR